MASLKQMLPVQSIECALAHWSPGIGDPGAVGWGTVIAYLAAATLSFAVGATGDRRGLERAFWAASGAGLLFLAVNKQLDLQSFMTAAGRCMAHLQGWYDTRRSIQVGFILGLIALCVVGGISALWILRGTLRRTGIALLGLVLITGFVLIRAMGFHHFDRLIGLQMAGVRLNWVFELGGIAVFLLGCIQALVAPRRS